jgi:glycerophosphoryl diester phosphodiesterase
MTLARIKACDAGKGERVPTFAEALALVRGKPVRLLVDVKAGTALAPVLRTVKLERAEQKIILGLHNIKQVTRAHDALPGTMLLANIPSVTDAAAFAKAGADIIRLWSDWVDADPGMIARTRTLGPLLWIMIGRDLPSKPAQWRALHARMIAAGAQGLITNRPDLVAP